MDEVKWWNLITPIIFGGMAGITKHLWCAMKRQHPITLRGLISGMMVGAFVAYTVSGVAHYYAPQWADIIIGASAWLGGKFMDSIGDVVNAYIKEKMRDEKENGD